MLIAPEGFGVAVASAAQLARPGRRVVCFTDAETVCGASDHVATAATLGLPVLIVVVGDPSTSVLATRADVRSFTAASVAGFAAGFEAALGAGGPALISLGSPY